MFLFVYGLIPFIYDLVQIRFFIAESLVLFAMCFLLEKKYLVFALLCVTSLYFHSMLSICFLIFFVPRDFILSQKASKRLLLVGCALACVCLISNPVVDFIKTFVSGFSAFNEYHRYLETSDVKLGFLLYVFYQTLNVLVAYYLNAKVSNKLLLPVWNMRLNTLNYNIQLIGVLLVVLSMININFSRFFRMLLMLNILNFSSLLYLENRCFVLGGKNDANLLCMDRNRLLNAFCAIFLIVGWIVGESFINQSYITILQSLKF